MSFIGSSEGFKREKMKEKEETPFATFPVVSDNFLDALMEARLLTKVPRLGNINVPFLHLKGVCMSILRVYIKYKRVLFELS